MANSVIQTILDAEQDAKSLSEFISKGANFLVPRRLSSPIHTLDYYTNMMRMAAANLGFSIVGTFANGATLKEYNDVVQAADGKLYRWSGSLPKTVAVGSTPENTGGYGSSAWLEVSDAALSKEIKGLGGASKIGSGVSVFTNLAEFLDVENFIEVGSKVHLLSAYQSGDVGHDGLTYTYTDEAESSEVQVITTNGFLSRPFENKVYIAEFGADGRKDLEIEPTGTNQGGYINDGNRNARALQKAFAFISAQPNPSKIKRKLLFGVNCSYHLAGSIKADCSYVHVDMGGSVVLIEDIRFSWSWFPLTQNFGDWNKVEISHGVFRVLGNDLFMAANFMNTDDLFIHHCDFYRINTTGHAFDINDSRDVVIEDCNIYGSNVTSRYFAEFMQIATGTYGGWPWSDSLTPEARQLFSGKGNGKVCMRRCVFKPFKDPNDGITYYPPRPIGNHDDDNSITEHFTIEDCVFDNVLLLAPTPQYSAKKASYQSILRLDCYAGLIFSRNKIISSNGNDSAIFVRTSAIPPHADISGKTIEYRFDDNYIHMIANSSGNGRHLDWRSHIITLEGDSDAKVELNITGNTLYSNFEGTEGRLYGSIVTWAIMPNLTINIFNNNIYSKGHAHYIHLASDTSRYDANHNYYIKNNVFIGEVKANAIYLTGGASSGGDNSTNIEYSDNAFKSPAVVTEVSDNVIKGAPGLLWDARGNAGVCFSVVKGNSFYSRVYKVSVPHPHPNAAKRFQRNDIVNINKGLVQNNMYFKDTTKATNSNLVTISKSAKGTDGFTIFNESGDIVTD